MHQKLKERPAKPNDAKRVQLESKHDALKKKYDVSAAKVA